MRFAPSPTGYLHVGGARTALYNYLYAKSQSGAFILRIEDTDQIRSTEAALKQQIEDLCWLGLKWDEGPDPDTLKDQGAFGPYRQSERKAIYKEYALRLIEKGRAYYCFCSDSELEKKKEVALSEGRSPNYDGHCRNLSIKDSLNRISSGQKAAIRFRIIDGKSYDFTDLIRGPIHFPSGMVGDFILIRSDGMPVYNYCCTIDDALMEISHVLRAEEHLNNTLRQLMILEAFHLPSPLYGHLSIILGEDKKKLSKREGATSCNDFRNRGFLPEALINYISLLGWSSPKEQEILSCDELISQFSLDRFTLSPAVFDDTKLKWVNSTHLRSLSPSKIWDLLQPFIKNDELKLPLFDSEKQEKMIELFKPKMETLSQTTELISCLSDPHFKIQKDCEEVLKWETTENILLEWHEKLKNISSLYLSEEEFLSIQKEIQIHQNIKGKGLFQSLRVALIGSPHGVDLVKLATLIPITSLIKRVEIVLDFKSDPI